MVQVITSMDEFVNLVDIVRVFYTCEVLNGDGNAVPMRERVSASYLLTTGWRSEAGYFLDATRGLPIGLWTPWGELFLNVNERVDWKKHLPKLLSELKAELFMGVRWEDTGEFGPIYSLRSVGSEKTLPKPLLTRYSLDRLNNKVCGLGNSGEDRQFGKTFSAWSTLCTQYFEINQI